MFASWGTYFKPIHLNNTLGVMNPGGDYTNPSTTPITVLTDSQGSGYTPMTTQFIDVYSGGSPFTLTQELVQRGAEVQEEEIRLAVCGPDIDTIMAIVMDLRRALTMQEYSGFQVLSIRRPNQTAYTEWFVQSALIQEDTTFLGRDVRMTGFPVVYLNIKLTRSPYGSDSATTATSTIGYDLNIPPFSFYGEYVFDVIDISANQNLVGSMINVDINWNLDSSTKKFGPSMLSMIVDDTVVEQTIAVSGTLAAGGSFDFASPYTYQLLDVQQSNAPLIVCVLGDVQSNEVEMRATIQGYSTPFVRTVGTNINTSNGTARLFCMPPINVSTIFSGFPDYNTSYSIPISISIRNINRGSTRTYSFTKLWMFRSDNIAQFFPTTLWTARAETYIQYRMASFYDQIDTPAQPLPSPKAMITTATEVGYDTRYVYSEACEMRGAVMRVKQLYGMMKGYIFNFDSTCSYIDPTWDFSPPDAPGIKLTFRFGALYQTIQG
jgi:hypothetical protein